MADGISESRFNMWRAVVAMVHADGVVKPHEINFILESTRDLSLSAEQREALNQDIYAPAQIKDLFQKISSPKDKEDFFHLARAVSWADGDFDAREEALLGLMGGLNIRSADAGLLEKSSSSFNDIYVVERTASNDQGLFAIIKRLMSGRR